MRLPSFGAGNGLALELAQIGQPERTPAVLALAKQNRLAAEGRDVDLVPAAPPAAELREMEREGIRPVPFAEPLPADLLEGDRDELPERRLDDVPPDAGGVAGLQRSRPALRAEFAEECGEVGGGRGLEG